MPAIVEPPCFLMLTGQANVKGGSWSQELYANSLDVIESWHIVLFLCNKPVSDVIVGTPADVPETILIRMEWTYSGSA
jgi:hypothetical protein